MGLSNESICCNKKIRKRTLKRRIFRVITLSNLITILILSFAIFLIQLMIIQGLTSSMSYFVSSNIVKEMQSPQFLKRMEIEELGDLSPNTKGFESWVHELNDMQTLDLSLWAEADEEMKRPNIKKLDKNNNLKIRFAEVFIEINDKVIYKTNENSETINDSNHPFRLFHLSQNKFFQGIIEETEVELPIINKYDEEIGYINRRLAPNLILFLIISLLITTIIISILTLLISKFLTRFFAMPVLKPLKELQNKMDNLSQEEIGDNFLKPISFKKPLYEIWRFADSTNQIMYKMNEYTKLLQEQKDEMEAQRDELESQKEELERTTNKLIHTNSILEQKNNQLENVFNNVSQGFLTFGTDLRVREEYSLECKKIFKKDIGDSYFPKLLFANDQEQIDFLEDILAKILLEKDPSRIQLYMPLLPEEIKIHNRFINIQYKIVIDCMDCSKKAFMIILNDITEKKSLEKQMHEERNTLKMVVKVISNQDTFLDLVESFENFTKNKLLELSSEDLSFDECYSEVYRQIHTFKGNFSQFNMNNVVNKLHKIESILSKEKNNIKNIGCHGLYDLLNSQEINNLLTQDIETLNKYLGNNFFNQQDILKIDKERVLDIENKMLETLSSYESNLLLPDIRKLRYKSLKDLLKRYPDYVIKLSDRQGKYIRPFNITGDNVLVDEDYYSDFIKSLIHIFRNSVDHGIEKPDERVVLGKNEIGTISCHIENEDDYIKITISDDGKGLDFKKIKERLLENNVYSKDEINNLDDTALKETIFDDSFSTVDNVTEISGRGVGLSAVKHELDKIGGRVKVITEKNKGLSFMFFIPLKHEDFCIPIHIKPIMDTLKENTSQFIKNHTNINFSPINKGHQLSSRINLNKITALINVRGSLNAIFVLSVNEILAKELVKGFVLGDIPPEDEMEFTEDAISEISNIILGNSVKVFDDMKYSINFGSPTILCYKGASIKNVGSNIVTSKLNSDEYEISLSIISIDNNIVEEE